MTQYAPQPQISVLDAGGQYCHLIARKVRELGVYADVQPSDAPAALLATRKGVIISGGPMSVYAPGSPTVDPELFGTGVPVLGICYGLQLMAHLLGGQVERGEKGEFGLAFLDLAKSAPLFEGFTPGQREQIWMSHRDTVRAVPPGFEALGSTDTCRFAAMADTARRLYGVQFHPEVVHTCRGREILENFVFRVSGCAKDWNPKNRIPLITERIHEVVGDRNVFFFVSGGVDSSVAYTLCLRALGPDRVRGIYVDTGLMRDGETQFVKHTFDRVAPGTVFIEPAEARFLAALAGAREPERKRRIIGEEFVRVQEEIIESGHFAEGDWILGQGTIYPDTIESGGTKNAALIKTHHNRVEGIQRLIATGRVIEPLSSFYKDEVREIGEELGLPPELLHRHPFPGPGLAIRCLCSEDTHEIRRTEEGWVVPIHSVGVQGDERSYRPVLVLEQAPAAAAAEPDCATTLINRTEGINRVVALVEGRDPLATLRVNESALTAERLARLRRADAVVRRLSRDSGFDARVWQFPVVLIPLGDAERPDSVVLRPIDSVDGMTARSVPMDPALLATMSHELLQIAGVAAVFYDLTHKPPATIEWE
ncbi:MAG TPA: glutamine-hydrolyzing GMP synthase [Bryobacteraceae bacterium]|nr:glutamine-hydrolyzing GMP synthase [Bryobacteraceae bacterium]